MIGVSVIWRLIAILFLVIIWFIDLLILSCILLWIIHSALELLLHVKHSEILILPKLSLFLTFFILLLELMHLTLMLAFLIVDMYSLLLYVLCMLSINIQLRFYFCSQFFINFDDALIVLECLGMVSDLSIKAVLLCILHTIILLFVFDLLFSKLSLMLILELPYLFCICRNASIIDLFF